MRDIPYLRASVALTAILCTLAAGATQAPPIDHARALDFIRDVRALFEESAVAA